MTALYRLLYRSHCAFDGAPEEVEAKVVAMVESARPANERSGVTGALLFAADVFVQAIEGPLDAVEETFERICADMRHRDLQLIDFTAAETRAFEEWSMAVVCPSWAFVSLCTAVEAIERTRFAPESSSAVVQLMRAMIVARAAGTDVAELVDVGLQKSA